MVLIMMGMTRISVCNSELNFCFCVVVFSLFWWATLHTLMFARCSVGKITYSDVDWLERSYSLLYNLSTSRLLVKLLLCYIVYDCCL